MTTTPHALALDALDKLDYEIFTRPQFATAHATYVRLDMLTDVRHALVWALDEIAALSEDLSGAQGAVVQLTDELALAEDELNEKSDLLADQRLDYALGV